MSDTGRFYVIDQETGRKFVIESIDETAKPADWGDYNPATHKIEGSYGSKHIGSIKEKYSIITKENGFETWTYFNGSYENGIKKLLELEKNENK
jgi:hypothetical protein